MLFNEPNFLFGFLPVVLFGFFILGSLRFYRLAAAWLAVASLTFYGWDSPIRLLSIICTSIIFNYVTGLALTRFRRKDVLWIGIAGNLLLLAWFKYAGFLSMNLNAVGFPLPVLTIVLPIGISFFTFTQIAFLVDSYRGEAEEYDFVHYVLFVSYFPHLIAGPIIHHKEMMPQFRRASTYQFNPADLALGLAWFSAGLFKKVIFADRVAAYVSPTFDAVATGKIPSFEDAWLASLSYALQLYFDFSGYSDMAIGLALMIGIRFPLNFYSPYKATSLIDFWRRWHMTLSHFLRNYLYIPLGGNRLGAGRRYVNLFITMVLGGLWHGASWNFIAWGAIHGLGLIVNHSWRAASARLRFQTPMVLGLGITLLLVVLAWVPFRSADMKTTVTMWAAMTNVASFGLPQSLSIGWLWIMGLSAIALVFPNTSQIFGWRHETFRASRPLIMMGVVTGLVLGVGIAGSLSQPSVFLYFRF